MIKKTIENKKTYRELGEEFFELRTEKSYNALYTKVRPGLRSYILKILKDEEATEDILSNTLLKLWTKIDQYKPEYNITTWLYRIAFNESLGYIREQNKKYSLDTLKDFGIEVNQMSKIDETISMLIEDVDAKTEQDYWDEENELMDRYRFALECIQNLKPTYRDMLEDQLVRKMKYEEIAQKHNVPLQTVKNRIRRGKMLVAEAMN